MILISKPDSDYKTNFTYSRIIKGEGLSILDKAPKKMALKIDEGIYEVKYDKDTRKSLVYAIGHLEWTFTYIDKKWETLYENFHSLMVKKHNKTLDFNIDLFKFPPKPHQVEVVERFKTKRNLLLADEMGSGKTMSAVYSASLLYGEIKHVLVICGKSSLQLQWKDEIEKFSTMDAKVLGHRINRKGKGVIDGIPKRTEELKNGLDEFFLITNVESFRNKKFSQEISDKVDSGEIGMIVIDEAHTIGNSGSLQGGNIVNNYGKAIYKLALTGTPVISKPDKLFGILKWLNIFQGPKEQYKQMFYVEDNWGKLIGFRNLDYLGNQLKKHMLRRKAPHTVELHVMDKLLYDEKAIKEDINGTIFERIIKTGLNKTKMEAVYEDTKEIVEQGDKTIVFSYWKTNIIDAYTDLLKEFDPIVITGDNSLSEQNDLIKEFKTSGNRNVLIATMRSIGTGQNLKEAKYIQAIDRPYSPSEFQQVLKRIHRLDSETDVFAFVYKLTDTVDMLDLEYMLKEKTNYLEELGLNSADIIEEDEDGI